MHVRFRRESANDDERERKRDAFQRENRYYRKKREETHRGLDVDYSLFFVLLPVVHCVGKLYENVNASRT